MPEPFDIRIWRSPASGYYADEPLQADDVYSDGELAAIAAEGFNGVWLRVILRDVVPTDLFAPYVEGNERRLAALQRLGERAAAHGLGVWLYFNEPMCLSATSPFWSDHADCKGMPGSSGMDGWPRTYAACTSAPPIRQFLRDACRELFRQVRLAGLFLITAAEHHTHCYSHVSTRGPGTEYEPREAQKCPRCRDRSPAEVIARLAGDISRGVHAGDADATVLVWSWRWSMFYDDPHAEIIDRLPKDTVLLSNFEEGQPIRRGGRDLVCEEYSLGVVGPAPLFEAQAQRARQRGLRVAAKLQIGTTHELATAPNLPAIGHLYRKLQAMRERDLIGYLGTWNFGCSRTVNSRAVRKLGASGALPDEDTFLRELCGEVFGPGADADKVAEAWQGFGRALQQHPMSLPFLYRSPLNYALAYPWPAERGTRKLARSWTTDPWGDDLEQSLPPYDIHEVIDLLHNAASLWKDAAEAYRAGLATAEQRELADRELATADYVYLCLASACNLYTWYAGVLAGRPDAKLIDAELARCRQALPLLEAYDDLGFHQECQHRQCSPDGVRAKIEQLRALAKRFGPA